MRSKRISLTEIRLTDAQIELVSETLQAAMHVLKCNVDVMRGLKPKKGTKMRTLLKQKKQRRAELAEALAQFEE